jgi:hypothetical protein
MDKTVSKAFFAGRKGRSALRATIASAKAFTARTGREAGFHAGAAGVDRKISPGGAKSWTPSPRITAGHATAGGAVHHTHPKDPSGGRTGTHSRADLRNVVTGDNRGLLGPMAKPKRNLSWVHAEDGSEAAYLGRGASRLPQAERAKAWREAEAGAGSTSEVRDRLRDKGILRVRRFAKRKMVSRALDVAGRFGAKLERPTRLRLTRPQNPFKAGTRATLRRTAAGAGAFGAAAATPKLR